MDEWVIDRQAVAAVSDPPPYLRTFRCEQTQARQAKGQTAGKRPLPMDRLADDQAGTQALEEGAGQTRTPEAEATEHDNDGTRARSGDHGAVTRKPPLCF